MSISQKIPALALAISMALCFQALAMSPSPDLLRSTASVGAAEAKIKTYREWKSERVQDAIARVTNTKTQLEITKSRDPNLAHQKGSLEASVGPAIERLEAQLQADQSFLETAKNFSVTDYLAGYLMKIQNKKAAFNEVAGKLTSDEIAELMSAYATSAFGSHSTDLGPSANSSAEDKVR